MGCSVWVMGCVAVRGSEGVWGMAGTGRATAAVCGAGPVCQTDGQRDERGIAGEGGARPPQSSVEDEEGAGQPLVRADRQRKWCRQ